jgi:hypothetical protein
MVVVGIKIRFRGVIGVYRWPLAQGSQFCVDIKAFDRSVFRVAGVWVVVIGVYWFPSFHLNILLRRNRCDLVKRSDLRSSIRLAILDFAKVFPSGVSRILNGDIGELLRMRVMVTIVRVIAGGLVAWGKSGWI